METVPFVLQGGEPVSSTRIRAAVAAGRLEEAVALLGHPYEIVGKVVPGKGLGRTLGFPTINSVLPSGLVQLPLGVYAVNTPFGRGVANYGRAPTLGEQAWTVPTLEVHLTGQTARVPSLPEALPVTFLRFLRPERKFDSLAALSAQIARDIAAADFGI